ncbi:MAG: hypothetical protein Q9227_004962 [Pyrenula ochraceoflavens]
MEKVGQQNVQKQDAQASQTFTHHAEAVFGNRDIYGPPGLRGLFYNPFVFFCAAFSTIGGLLFGYDQGVVSVILVMPQFLQRFTRVSEHAAGAGFWKGFLTAMIELGAMIGAFNQGWIADKYSRKYSILIAVVVFIIGSVLQTAAVDYAMLTVARLVGGVGIGMLSMVAPLYISEISPPEIRGTLLVLEEFSIVTGIVVAFWITYGTRHISGEWGWRLPFLIQIIPALVLGAGVLFLPFSPRWLISKGRVDEGLQTLSKVRRLPETDPRVRLEHVDIQAEAKFVGINALIYYSPSLFETMGLDYDMQLIMSGILNVTQLVGVATSIWTIDSGRRRLLLAGSVMMTISHIVIAILVGKFGKDWPSHRPEGWTSVAFLLLYMFSFGSSWGPVPWAMPAGKHRMVQFFVIALVDQGHRDLSLFSESKRRKLGHYFQLVQ